ncbi:integral membrane sensor signal transduction his tidine kinase [Formosa agariphila KMM 3901]|uniref:histidine kinase n=1 Tax=Formosa agariphila (strain DSM 15362 / KCTC 12365 / LMG 23005 / KMM 3901 / M-2Alg 35-1) TaxID=1347342 RepID=T2KR98_FORAG|nr:sensor histidine kinase [Formosa agariphila]CDF81255.1 integral membrane sensor signal transduction his tidine kinase [Formosa agariphila KMM 3901]
MLSFTFYNEFSKVLDDRILLQLNSVKTLKQIQVENLISSEWNAFLKGSTTASNLDTLNIHIPEHILQTTGIHDLTPYNLDGHTSIGLISTTSGQPKIKIIPYYKINNILLERAGMGSSGESYLVGTDFTMRSQSRFSPQKLPSTITAKTKGVQDALSGAIGRGVFKDYRGIEVYSVYSLINISNLKLVILSEIDISEVKAPLSQLKLKLLGLTILIMSIAIILSLFLTRIITNPITNMRESLKIMAAGNYKQNKKFVKNSSEIKDMFEALDSLKKSLQGAVNFSNELGKMNLNSQYVPKGNNDVLGKSLIKMRNKLIEFRNKETKNSITTKRQLVDGLENERRRLSRELHDGIGPLLTSLKFYIENHIEDKNQKLEMIRILDTTISEIRLMSNALMPSTIDDFGVGVALTNFVNNIKKTSGISIEFEDLTDEEISKITKNQSINIFRIGQELVNNALKHSHAENIRISLSEFDEFISLFYYDDGIGFDLKKVTLGSGIINIKERVEICNGDIQIHSKKGNTTIEIELPIDI